MEKSQKIPNAVVSSFLRWQVTLWGVTRYLSFCENQQFALFLVASCSCTPLGGNGFERDWVSRSKRLGAVLGLSKVNEGRPNENTLSTKGEINALNPHLSPHTSRSQGNAVSLLGKTARRGEKSCIFAAWFRTNANWWLRAVLSSDKGRS